MAGGVIGTATSQCGTASCCCWWCWLLRPQLPGSSSLCCCLSHLRLLPRPLGANVFTRKPTPLICYPLGSTTTKPAPCEREIGNEFLPANARRWFGGERGRNAIRFDIPTPVRLNGRRIYGRGVRDRPNNSFVMGRDLDNFPRIFTSCV